MAELSQNFGPVEAKVREDVSALITEHPMGEALAEMAFKLARTLDGNVAHLAIAAINRELRGTLMDLAKLGVDADDDLDARLSVPTEVRDAPDA